MRSSARLSAALYALLAATAPLHASDGVIEINQVRALAGGVTPGDDPGFPVTISAPGSYMLTGNLDVRVEASPLDATAILFDAGAASATLDLNGFALLGPRVGCVATNCAVGTGTGSGIRIATDWISVRNGFVQGFGFIGVNATGHRMGSLEQLVSYENGDMGFATDGHTVRSCEATHNANHGFDVKDSRVESSRSIGNASSGFRLLQSSAAGCVATYNAMFGFVLTNSTLRDSISHDNNYAIDCWSSLIAGNQLAGAFNGVCTQLEPNICGNALCP